MRRLLLGAAIAAAAAVMPSAAAEITNPTSTVDHLTPSYVADVLKELGAQDVQIEKIGATDEIVRFRDGEIPYHVAFFVCEAQGCLSMVILVGFEPSGTHYPLELFNAFNKEHPFVTAVQLDGNKFGISRMVVVEGGITKRNLAFNISLFANMPAEIMKYLSSQFVAGIQPGNNASPTQPVSASVASLRAVALTPAEIGRMMSQVKTPQPGLNMRR